MRAAKRRTSGPYLRKPRAICVYLSGRYDHAVQMDTPESVVEIIPQKIWRSAGPKNILAKKHPKTQRDQTDVTIPPKKELERKRSLKKKATPNASHPPPNQKKTGPTSWG